MEQEPKTATIEGIKHSWSEYIQKKGVPRAVVLDITNFCNCAECAHCYIKAVKYGEKNKNSAVFMDEMTAGIWAKTLASNPQGRPEQIWVSGGEPTLHPLLSSILGHLKEQKFYTALITNGEKLVDEKYCQELTSSGYLDEACVTVRGEGILHDVFMLSAENPFWELVPENLSVEEQIDFVKSKIGKAKHFETTVQGLINLAKASKMMIGLNIDIQEERDMEKIVKKIIEKGGRADNIYLQVQQETGRAKGQIESLPNLWRKPNLKMAREYLEQSKRLLNEGLVKKITIIDPLPTEIVNSLSLTKEPIYQPKAVPAISPAGELREDVLYVE